MRTFVILSSIVFYFTSCDTRKDYNKELNKAPELSIRRNDSLYNGIGTYVNTINDSFKLSQGKYYFDYYLKDDENFVTIKKTFTNIGAGSFVSKTDQPHTVVIYDPKYQGFQSINVKVTDSYEVSSTATINLTVFRNLLPVAKLDYYKTAVLDPLEYEIEGGQSFDKDASFGGKIINYEFSISPDYQVTTPYNYIKYIFPTTGNYQVSLRVQDNDGDWSPSIVIYISVS